MQLTRRNFFKAAGTTGGGMLFGFLGLDVGRTRAYASAKSAAAARSRITTTICPY